MGAGLKNTYLGSPNLITRSKVTSYTGDGAATQTIAVGFQPDAVIISVDFGDGTKYFFVKIASASSGAWRWLQGGVNQPDYGADKITAFTANGFTVSNADGANTAGKTYYYLAIKGE